MKGVTMATALLVALLLLLGVTTPSGAGVLTTPELPVGSQQAVVCTLTNIDTKPITITAITLVGPTGFDVLPAFDGCSGLPELAPRATCIVRAPVGTDCYCSFSMKSSKVRAAGTIQDSVAPFTVTETVPATK
jgi:hypothetical protein